MALCEFRNEEEVQEVQVFPVLGWCRQREQWPSGPAGQGLRRTRTRVQAYVDREGKASRCMDGASSCFPFDRNPTAKESSLGGQDPSLHPCWNHRENGKMNRWREGRREINGWEDGGMEGRMDG